MFKARDLLYYSLDTLTLQLSQTFLPKFFSAINIHLLPVLIFPGYLYLLKISMQDLLNDKTEDNQPHQFGSSRSFFGLMQEKILTWMGLFSLISPFTLMDFSQSETEELSYKICILLRQKCLSLIFVRISNDVYIVLSQQCFG